MPSASPPDHRPLVALSLTVNEVLARFPATAVVFNAFGVDTCCGGDVAVTQAAAEARQDPQLLLASLEAAAAATLDREGPSA